MNEVMNIRPAAVRRWLLRHGRPFGRSPRLGLFAAFTCLTALPIGTAAASDHQSMAMHGGEAPCTSEATIVPGADLRGACSLDREGSPC